MKVPDAPAGEDAAGRAVPATVTTVARGLLEPSDVLVEHDADGNDTAIVVVESNAHRLTRLAVPEEFLTVDEGARQTQRPRTPVVAGDLDLTIGFAAPTLGFKDPPLRKHDFLVSSGSMSISCLGLFLQMCDKFHAT